MGLQIPPPSRRTPTARPRNLEEPVTDGASLRLCRRDLDLEAEAGELLLHTAPAKLDSGRHHTGRPRRRAGPRMVRCALHLRHRLLSGDA